MTRIKDAVARMAIDAAFVARIHHDPDGVASEYGLSPSEIERLQGLVPAAAGSGPVDLGSRESRSAIGAPVDDLFAVMFNPQPEPPEPPDWVASQAPLGPPADEVGYYPWPNLPPDPFAAAAGQPEALPTQPGPAQPGAEEGIIIINSQPVSTEPAAYGTADGLSSSLDPVDHREGEQMPPAPPGEDEGIIIINSTPPDPIVPAEDEGIIIINSAPPDPVVPAQPPDPVEPAPQTDEAVAGDGREARPGAAVAPVKPMEVDAPGSAPSGQGSNDLKLY